jgi:hypothetical protein
VVNEKDPQDAALAKLHEAIRVYLEETDSDTGLLTEWAMVTAQHVITEGGSGTSLSTIVSDELPVYRMLGLYDCGVAYTKVRLFPNG